MRGKTVTFFCAFSRPWAIKRWIKDFQHINRNQDHSLMHLAFIVDIDCPEIWIQLRHMAHKDGYASCEVAMNRAHNPTEVHTSTRRKRIALLKNQSCELIQRHHSDFVIALEDDSTLDHLDSLDRLIAPLASPRVGMVSGIQCGRWMLKYAGAWKFDNHLAPSVATTVVPTPSVQLIMPPHADYQIIDAAGFYCYATPRGFYLKHEYYWSEDQPWGPDVNYGLWLRQLGFEVLADWRTPIGHNDHNNIIEVYDDKEFRQVCYTKNNDNSWRRQ